MTDFVRELVIQVLIALIVAVLQFLWVRLRQRGREHRVRRLRDQITSLNDFLASASALGDTPEAEHARSTAAQERAALLVELASATQQAARPAETGAPGFGQLSGIRRALLLYVPKRATAWFGQALFFLSLIAMLFGVVGVWGEGPMSLLMMIVVNGLFAWGARTLTVYSDLPSSVQHVRQAPYPAKPTLCLAFALMILSLLIIGVSIEGDDTLSFAALLASVRQDTEVAWSLFPLLLLIVVSLGWRQSFLRHASAILPPQVGPIRRLLLLYVPSRPAGWVIRTLFFAAIVASAAVAWIAGRAARQNPRDGDTVIGTAFFLIAGLLSIVCAHRWAALLDAPAGSLSLAAAATVAEATPKHEDVIAPESP